ncbi:hypothetical protein [Priestia aryabhattai]|uniref:hypothetical protein n=1 Tax=Priestia aryabhattai TaxID=412384 RepID=UPI003735F999
MSTNPRKDYFLLKNGLDYIEVEAKEESIINTPLWIEDNLDKAREIGINGATKVRKYFDSKFIVNPKLSHIFNVD